MERSPVVTIDVPSILSALSYFHLAWVLLAALLWSVTSAAVDLAFRKMRFSGARIALVK
jgi:hypothetical protein